MVFTSIDWIALIFIVFAIVKVIILLINPTAWMRGAQKFFKKTILAQIIAFVLAAVIFYYLIQEGFRVVQILAITAFVTMLLVIGLAKHLDSLMVKYNKMIEKGKLWKDNWFYTLLWLILMGLGIKELFF